MLIIVISFALLGYFYANAAHVVGVNRLVTIHDRGQDRVILTTAHTVQGALDDAHIKLATGDTADPVLSTELVTTDSTVNIYRARLVIVADGAVREKVVTAAPTPDKILADADLPALGAKDTTKLSQDANLVADGASTLLTVTRAAPPTPTVQPTTGPTFRPNPGALTRAKSAQMFTDSHGVTHRETYYDLPMNVVIRACGGGGYTIRADGAKVDKDGYILVAASLQLYPRCSVVETSMGPGRVYDTGGFVARYPTGFDLATDWTNYDGR